MTTMQALRQATMGSAEGLKLDRRIGALTPGKEADIILPDASTLNGAPRDYASGAVVTLRERSNVDTVPVAGQVKRWNGVLLPFDLARLTADREASRDHLFAAARIDRNLFA